MSTINSASYLNNLPKANRKDNKKDYENIHYILVLESAEPCCEQLYMISPQAPFLLPQVINVSICVRCMMAKWQCTHSEFILTVSLPLSLPSIFQFICYEAQVMRIWIALLTAPQTITFWDVSSGQYFQFNLLYNKSHNCNLYCQWTSESQKICDIMWTTGLVY